MVSPKKVHVQTLVCRKLHKQLSNSVTEVVKTTEWCPFVIFLARDGSWVTNIFGFLMVRSAKCYQEKHLLPPRHE
jgi:hypothetical protein